MKVKFEIQNDKISVLIYILKLKVLSFSFSKENLFEMEKEKLASGPYRKSPKLQGKTVKTQKLLPTLLDILNDVFDSCELYIPYYLLDEPDVFNLISYTFIFPRRVSLFASENLAVVLNFKIWKLLLKPRKLLFTLKLLARS